MVNAESAKGEKRGGSRGHIARHILFLQCSREVVGAMTDPLLTLVAESIEAALKRQGLRLAIDVAAQPDVRLVGITTGGGAISLNELAQAALSVIREQEGWRPIEEAPKDAVIILGRVGMNPAAGKWRHGRWQVVQFEPDDWLTPYDFQTPTHFRPLPAPPLERP